MSAPAQPDAQAIRCDAQWHFHDLDPEQRTANLLQLSEADYRQLSFLDQRAEPFASAHAEVSLQDLEQALTEAESASASAHFIFHHGHCGSTLLSRALAATNKVLPIREPLTLRRLAGPVGPSNLLKLAVKAHSRSFHPGQVSVVKATSICNSLIQPILADNLNSRAIMIYVPLESFLAGMLGKQTPALDLQGHAAHRLAEWNRISGTPELIPEHLSEAQLAVLAWLTSMNLMLNAAEAFPASTLLLNFEDLLAKPEASLSEGASLIGLEAQLDTILAAWPDISTGYSKKPDEPYSAFNRRKTLQRGRMLRSDEIQQGLRWAKKLISATDSSSALPGLLQTH